MRSEPEQFNCRLWHFLQAEFGPNLKCSLVVVTTLTKEEKKGNDR